MAEQTITVWDQRARNAGTYTSQSNNVPADLTEVRTTLLLDQADLDDPTLEIPWSMEGSWDGGATWQTLMGGVWQGGPDLRGNPQPQPVMAYSTTGPWPSRARGGFTIPRRTNIGVTLTLVTPA